MSGELKLKPCPLCGGKADFWGGTGAVLAGCPKCHIHTIYCYPPEDAARFWNSRPAENAKIAQIAELEKMAEARKLANRLLEQERNELEAECVRLRGALGRVVKLLDRPMLKNDMCLYMNKAIRVAREALEDEE